MESRSQLMHNEKMLFSMQLRELLQFEAITKHTCWWGIHERNL